MAILNADGDAVTFEEIAERHYSKKNGGRVLATDMDGTMFTNDLGRLVFMEKLGDPHFWELDIVDFSGLVLPGQYEKIMMEGAINEHGDNLPTELCWLALHLRDDIVNLYALMKTMVSGKRRSSEESRVINEFARKMMELDRIFLVLDRYLSKMFDGQLLMRTRFFAGKDAHAVHSLTDRVMKRRRTDVGVVMPLQIYEENEREANQVVTEEWISDAYGVESPLRRIDRFVTPIDEVRDVIREAIGSIDALAVVVTANLEGIAKTAVRKSKYDFLRNQGESEVVIGSRLRTEGKKFHARVAGKPVFGKRKAAEAKSYAQKRGKKLGMAVGDSPGTDGAMVRESIAQGGTGLIVCEDIETASEAFAPYLRLHEIGNGSRERLYFVVPDGASFRD